MTPNKKMISIIFSFRNEEENLHPLIQRIENVFKPLGFEYEMIFVNDDSTDHSLDILLNNRKKNPRIKIVNMSRRFGVHPCVMAGLNRAKGDAVIYMDTDLQDPPELIPEMIKKWENGADVVHTKRRTRQGESPFKMWVTRKAYKIIDLFSEVPIPSNCGDFKLLSRKVLHHLLKFKEYNPFMRGLSLWIGHNQEFLEYDREPRHGGKTHFSLFSLGPIKEFERGMINFSEFPLKISLIIGFIAATLSFLYIPIILINKLLGSNLPGWSALMTATVFLNGMILFTIGIVGLYIGRIYKEVQGRPSYIIKEKIGFD